MESITKTLIKSGDRLDFLPKHVGRKFLQYEQAIYRYMHEYCEGYTGGMWNYYTLSNGGFFMAWDADETSLKVSQPMNYYEGEMSAEAASVGMNLYVQNAFAHQVDAERFSEAFHALRDFAIQHQEAAQIMAFID